jgi:hypothetical protein
LQLSTDTRLDLARLGAVFHAQDGDLPGVGLAQSQDAFHRGRLARAIGAEQAKDLA